MVVMVEVIGGTRGAVVSLSITPLRAHLAVKYVAVSWLEYGYNASISQKVEHFPRPDMHPLGTTKTILLLLLLLQLLLTFLLLLLLLIQLLVLVVLLVVVVAARHGPAAHGAYTHVDHGCCSNDNSALFSPWPFKIMLSI